MKVNDQDTDEARYGKVLELKISGQENVLDNEGDAKQDPLNLVSVFVEQHGNENEDAQDENGHKVLPHELPGKVTFVLVFDLECLSKLPDQERQHHS